MIRKLICINSLVGIGFALFFLIYPPLRAALDLRDPALQQPGIPQAAWRLYRNLTPRYGAWARQRMAQGQPQNLSLQNISGTEWPLFGSVFFLWSLENLQSAWDAGQHSGQLEPKVFAREAIIAASELVIAPNHAAWVKKHWGEDYLKRQNVFYRMMVIAALTSRQNLLHEGAHLELLREQVESFAKELDGSKTGLLDDYPGECYPGDVMAALMCIQRADAVLGTDHSPMLKRALRGFVGTHATPHQLPPYAANAGTGAPTTEARGCANSYFCLTAPELWPAQARQWFELYDKFFWQQRISAVGYREFPKGLPRSEWGFNVDAGPIIAGHGVAASAFGLGAARKNGRFDRAYPLAAELLVTTLELPNGVLAMPRLLSNLSDAPLLGEAGILWQLSLQPQAGFPIRRGAELPSYVYIVLSVLCLLGLWRILVGAWTIKMLRHQPEPAAWAPLLQVIAWSGLALGAVAALWLGHSVVALLLMLCAMVLPVLKRAKISKGTEDWPDQNPLAPLRPLKDAEPDSPQDSQPPAKKS